MQSVQNFGRLYRRHLTSVGLLVALPFLILAGQSRVSAQSNILTAIIPTKVEGADGQTLNTDFNTSARINLTFQAPALPAGAQVIKGTLQLSLKDTLRGADGDLRVVFVGRDKQEKNFGSRHFDVSTPGANNPIRWTTSSNVVPAGITDLSKNPGSPFVLSMVASRNSNPARLWYSINADNRNFRPRLILEYSVPGRGTVSQTQGLPAMQSAGKFLPDPVAAAQFGSLAISGIWSHVPVSYKNLVYLIVKSGAQSQLQALPAGGGPAVWTSQNLDGAGQHLVLSELGHLYIVGNGAIFAFQLDPNSGIPTPGAIVRDANGLNPSIAPAVGADGSLYLVYNQAVFARNPNLQELWRVPLNSPSTSRITVGPSGRFVYLTVNGQGLLAIKAQTGETAPIADGQSQQMLARTANISFQAPAIIQHPDGTEKVYLVANAATTGTLAAFDNSNAAKDPPPTEINLDQLTESWPALPGLWSQPLLDLSSPGTKTSPSTTKKVYAVLVTNGTGTMTAVDWLQGTTANLTPTFAAADLLNPASNGTNLGIDQSGTIVIWNAKGGNLTTFSSSAGTVLAVASQSGLVEGTRLVFGTDGTWYAIDPSGGGTLRIVVPQYSLNSDSSPTLTSPEHIRVTGTATKDTTISAPGYIFLGIGFRVPLGKTLSVKQPKP